MSDLPSPLGGDDLAKALRDAYGQGAAHFERLRETGESVSSSLDKRDAWIAQYMARMPAAEPIATILPKSAFRQGRRVPRNVYRDDLEPLFMAATEEQAAELVAILNAGAAVLRSGKLVASTGSEADHRELRSVMRWLSAAKNAGGIEDPWTQAQVLGHAVDSCIGWIREYLAVASPTPKSSPDQTPVDPQMTVEEAQDWLDSFDTQPGLVAADYRRRCKSTTMAPEVRATLLKAASRIELALRTLQAGGEVR
ncbi:hypothetical protein ACQKQD_19020 [Methylobacterium sp. NPDC080182]|uniref:hypothetical protein n=1 Tax=Methylobacterium sp. NPDC080182 TaxID=3390590 RepID=UPI003D037BDF